MTGPPACAQCQPAHHRLRPHHQSHRHFTPPCRGRGQNAQTTRAQILLETDAACFAILQARSLLDVAEQDRQNSPPAARQHCLAAEKPAQVRHRRQLRRGESQRRRTAHLPHAQRPQIRPRHDRAAAARSRRQRRIHITSPPPACRTASKADGLVQMASTCVPNSPSSVWSATPRKNSSKPKTPSAARASPCKAPPEPCRGATAASIKTTPPPVSCSPGRCSPAASTPPAKTKPNSAPRPPSRPSKIRKPASPAMCRSPGSTPPTLSNASTSPASLREQSAQAYSLAEARYNAGSSSVVELSQAQLNLTASEINQTTTRYEYLLRRSILDFQTGMMLRKIQTPPAPEKGR
jgi:hypothetical protein